MAAYRAGLTFLPISYDATTSDSDPSGALLLLIDCATMADLAHPA
jgi:hypothetical protein